MHGAEISPRRSLRCVACFYDDASRRKSTHPARSLIKRLDTLTRRRCITQSQSLPAENSQREHFSDFGGDFLASLRKRSVQSNLSAGRIATAHPLLRLLACSMRSRVYVTVVCPSVRPSVFLSRLSTAAAACGCERRRGQQRISVELLCVRRAYRRLSISVSAARARAAAAGSVMSRAEVRGSTRICCNRVHLDRCVLCRRPC